MVMILDAGLHVSLDEGELKEVRHRGPVAGGLREHQGDEGGQVAAEVAGDGRGVLLQYLHDQGRHLLIEIILNLFQARK